MLRLFRQVSEIMVLGSGQGRRGWSDHPSNFLVFYYISWTQSVIEKVFHQMDKGKKKSQQVSHRMCKITVCAYHIFIQMNLTDSLPLPGEFPQIVDLERKGAQGINPSSCLALMDPVYQSLWRHLPWNHHLRTTQILVFKETLLAVLTLKGPHISFISMIEKRLNLTK